MRRPGRFFDDHPVASLVLFYGLLVWGVTAGISRLAVLRADETEFWRFVLIGVAASALWLVVAVWLGRRNTPWLLIVLIPIFWALGTALPRWSTPSAASQTVALAFLLPIGIGFVAYSLPRVVRRLRKGDLAAEHVTRTPTERQFPREKHEAFVMDVRPFPNKHEFDPYFIAMCECGWLGKPRDSSIEAFSDANGHTPFVRQAVERPVG